MAFWRLFLFEIQQNIGSNTCSELNFKRKEVLMKSHSKGRYSTERRSFGGGVSLCQKQKKYALVSATLPSRSPMSCGQERARRSIRRSPAAFGYSCSAAGAILTISYMISYPRKRRKKRNSASKGSFAFRLISSCEGLRPGSVKRSTKAMSVPVKILVGGTRRFIIATAQ